MQRWMLDALILPGRVDRDEVERRFTASANLQPAACLAIYQRGYILRLGKCLAEQFPALCHALGEKLFDQFAREYLRVCPSDSYTLYELGRRFCDYLEDARPDRDLLPEQREGWIDFMVDLARYERLHFRLFDAPGHEGGPWPTPELPDDRLIYSPASISVFIVIPSPGTTTPFGSARTPRSPRSRSPMWRCFAAIT